MTPLHPHRPARLLVVPGLHDSPPEHWQSWLQRLHRHAVRVTQHDWAEPELERWSARIGSTLDRAGPGPWIAVAHSFGVLALVHHLAHNRASPVAAALLVAPAHPDRFGIGAAVPRTSLAIPSTTVLSRNDPWMPLSAGRAWAQRWGSAVVDLGDAGHVNVDAGFGSFPYARRWLIAMGQRLERDRRQQRATFQEWAFAV